MLTSWVVYLVEEAIGFMVPRMMDRQIGQTSLGVWDFAWSCVSDFRLAQIGVAQAPLYWKFLAPEQVRKLVLGRVPQALACRLQPPAD